MKQSSLWLCLSSMWKREMTLVNNKVPEITWIWRDFGLFLSTFMLQHNEEIIKNWSYGYFKENKGGVCFWLWILKEYFTPLCFSAFQYQCSALLQARMVLRKCSTHLCVAAYRGWMRITHTAGRDKRLVCKSQLSFSWKSLPIGPN